MATFLLALGLITLVVVVLVVIDKVTDIAFSPLTNALARREHRKLLDLDARYAAHPGHPDEDTRVPEPPRQRPPAQLVRMCVAVDCSARGVEVASLRCLACDGLTKLEDVAARRRDTLRQSIAKSPDRQPAAAGERTRVCNDPDCSWHLAPVPALRCPSCDTLTVVQVLPVE